MRYFIDFDDNRSAIGFLTTDNADSIGYKLVEVTKKDFKHYFEESGNVFVDVETIVIKPSKTKLEILQERILQVETLQVNTMSLQIENQILGGI